MKDFLTLQGKMLVCSLKDWNITLSFWVLVVAIEVMMNLLK
jgi:hypothetical protein